MLFQKMAAIRSNFNDNFVAQSLVGSRRIRYAYALYFYELN
jgi:hypothetical protein|tara:strand:- start:420 stop:542 length:123 start_codon:yes stop_codon:yes gene_type:complete